MRSLIFIFLFLFSKVSLAFFCPGNFNQIDIGDTIEQVKLQCGNPDGQKKEKKVDENIPQEWSFYLNPGTNSYGVNLTNAQQASVKMTVAFDQNKVINITVNNMSLASTSICGNTISVGANQASVKAACGKPLSVVKSEPPEGPDNTPEIVTFIYNNTPPVKLIFENGKLIERD